MHREADRHSAAVAALVSRAAAAACLCAVSPRAAPQDRDVPAWRDFTITSDSAASLPPAKPARMPELEVARAFLDGTRSGLDSIFETLAPEPPPPFAFDAPDRSERLLPLGRAAHLESRAPAPPELPRGSDSIEVIVPSPGALLLLGLSGAAMLPRRR